MSAENPVLAGGLQRQAESMNMFSLKPLFYGFGTSYAHYTYTIIVAAACGLFVICRRFPNQPTGKIRKIAAFAACAALSAFYLINIFVIGPMLWGPSGLLRYVCPVIMAAVPSVLIMASQSACDVIRLPKAARIKSPPSKRLILVFGAFSIILLVAFLRSSLARAGQALRHGSILAFSQTAINPSYIEHTRNELSPLAKEAIRKAQQIVPEGQILATWTHRATHIDHKRNRIVDITPAGLFAPWIDLPFIKGSDEAIEYFTGSGVHYVLWQYSPVIRTGKQFVTWMASPYRGERILAHRTWQFMKMLEKMAADSQILYDDGQIRILKLPKNRP
jgi:hypothetical protein